MKNDKTPLNVNVDLVKRTRLTSHYTGGEGSTTGPWNPEKAIKGWNKNNKSEDSEDSSDSNDSSVSNKNNENTTQKDNLHIDSIVGPKEPEKYIDGTVNPRWVVWNDLYGSESPNKMKTPLKTRLNYIPSTSPLRQEEPQMEGSIPEVEIFDKAKPVMAKRMMDKELQAFGTLGSGNIYDSWNKISQEELEEKKGDYINNFNFGAQSAARLDILGNNSWKEACKSYLKKVKQNMNNAIKDGRTDIAGTWMDNARNFIENIKTFELKKSDDWANQYSDETQGNAGGSVVSKGSHKGDMRKYDMTFMGADNIDIDIAEEGDLYFKMRGVDDIWTVKDLGKNVFMKNFKGIQIWETFKKDLRNLAKQGKPIASSIVKGTVNSMLANKHSILSLLHDDILGNQSIFEMMEEEAIRRNLDFNKELFMPESKDFNMDLVQSMVEKGLINMANLTHASFLPTKAIAKSAATATELIKKYSR